MGISYSPGGAEWSHEGYHMFRRRLAALDGIDLDRMRGYTATGAVPLDWEDYPTALEPLLNSNDTHGFISGEACRRMLPRLRVIADGWATQTDPDDNEAHDLQALQALIEGMEHCAEHGCALSYG